MGWVEKTLQRVNHYRLLGPLHPHLWSTRVYVNKEIKNTVVMQKIANAYVIDK
jgi:hypothetical protein